MLSKKVYVNSSLRKPSVQLIFSSLWISLSHVHYASSYAFCFCGPRMLWGFCPLPFFLAEKMVASVLYLLPQFAKSKMSAVYWRGRTFVSNSLFKSRRLELYFLSLGRTSTSDNSFHIYWFSVWRTCLSHPSPSQTFHQIGLLGYEKLVSFLTHESSLALMSNQ